jgi:nucleotide-binding universal stress UspA family protein
MNTLSNIVVPVDFSACCLVALRQALRLARASRAKVHAIHVVDTLVAVQTTDELSSLQQQIVASLLSEARESWADFSRRAGAGEDVSFHVEINSPSAAIARFAKEKHADLVVMGVHGVTAHARGTGSVASSVVKRCKSNVLLVQDDAPEKFARVLACVDFSPTSREALEHAMRLAAIDGAEVHALYAYTPPWEHLRPRAGAPESSPEFRATYAKALEQRLQAFADPQRPDVQWARPVFHARAHKHHAKAISETARELHADLVVLGTRGASNLREVLLGSTAERVVRDAHTSILAVHSSQ